HAREKFLGRRIAELRLEQRQHALTPDGEALPGRQRQCIEDFMRDAAGRRRGQCCTHRTHLYVPERAHRRAPVVTPVELNVTARVCGRGCLLRVPAWSAITVSIRACKPRRMPDSALTSRS